MADKDFQEVRLTQAEPTADLIATPGQISISGNFGGGPVPGRRVDVSLTGDDSAAPYLVVTADTSQYVIANRLTFTAAGGAGTDISVKWFPVRTPY